MARSRNFALAAATGTACVLQLLLASAPLVFAASGPDAKDAADANNGERTFPSATPKA